MANFEEMLQQLHTGAIMSDTNDRIIIGANRIFSLPEGFDPIIAYEGDVNTQIITFQCPKHSDGHDLSQCFNKRLRWKNLTSENEGSSILSFSTEEENDTLLLFWEVPAEASNKSGKIQISISIYDITNNKIAYAWNTPLFSELEVGESIDSVGYFIGQENTEQYMPAKDEILTINTDTRQIVAPAGYNYTICNYGDVGTSAVYFQIKRYIKGIDLLSDTTGIIIYWQIGDIKSKDINNVNNNPLSSLYAIELDNRDSEGLVNIVWRPSPNLTSNTMYLFGQITIQIEINSEGRVWRTSGYDKLSIGENIFPLEIGQLPEVEDADKEKGYVIDGSLIVDSVDTPTIAGLVKLRTCTEDEPIYVRENELVVEYDNNGNYKGVKIGTTKGYQCSRSAPYVAIAPSTTILLHGGNADGAEGEVGWI